MINWLNDCSNSGLLLLIVGWGQLAFGIFIGFMFWGRRKS